MKKTDVSLKKKNSRQARIRGMYGSRYTDMYTSVRDAAASAAADLGRVNIISGSHEIVRGIIGDGSQEIVRGIIAGGGQEIVKGKRIRFKAVPKYEAGLFSRIYKKISLRILLFSAAFLFVVAAVVVLMTFNLKRTVVHGTDIYDQEEIESFITKGYLGRNTFVMALKYHNRAVKDIPFIDRIDVDITSPSTIRVNIKERPADGYVFYKSRYVYVSREGVIQAVSKDAVKKATQIKGVVLTHSKTGNRALAKNQYGLDISLELMKIMEKYGILAEAGCISVDEKSRLTVSFGDVKVQLGRSGYDEKMYKIQQILPNLKGRSGIINMTGLDDYSNLNIVLMPKPTSSEEDIQAGGAGANG